MIVMLAGLLLFLGPHSVHIFAPAWRDAQRRRLGDGPWKGLYALVSIVGFVLIVWGYGLARQSPELVWVPPVWTRHLASLLTLPAFMLLIAPYIPGNHFVRWFGHPMLLGTKLWALAHLLANGFVHDIVLFGAFLAWAVLAYASGRRRDRATGRTRPPASWQRTVLVVVMGGVLWWLFATWLHARLIGVAPFG